MVDFVESFDKPRMWFECDECNFQQQTGFIIIVDLMRFLLFGI